MERREVFHVIATPSICFSFVLILLSISGCAQNLAHHIAMKDARNFSEYYTGLDPVAPGYGRVIIYWEKKPMLPASGTFKIQGDAGYLTLGFGAQTGTLIDLPVGDYSLTSGGPLNKNRVLFSVHDGAVDCYSTETLYNFMMGSMSGGITPIQTQECLSNLVNFDIRCNLRSCQVLSVVPSAESLFVPYSTIETHEQIEQASKDFSTPADRSRIYITRKMYTLGMVKSGLDGKPTLTMESSSYTCYDVEPGFHVITVHDPGGDKGFAVNAKGGANYFFHTDTLDFLPITIGEERVNDSDLLKGGFHRSGKSMNL